MNAGISTTAGRSRVRRWFRRRPWVNAATVLIIAGTFMLLQPFWMVLYSYSFTVVVAGTIGYLIVSHFPDEEDG